MNARLPSYRLLVEKSVSANHIETNRKRSNKFYLIHYDPNLKHCPTMTCLALLKMNKRRASRNLLLMCTLHYDLQISHEYFYICIVSLGMFFQATSLYHYLLCLY